MLALAYWIHSPGISVDKSVERRSERAAISALRAQLASTARELEQSAGRAAAVSSDASRAFMDLDRISSPSPDRGLVVYSSGTPAAWSGHIYVAPDSLRRPSLRRFASFDGESVPYFLTEPASEPQASRHRYSQAGVGAWTLAHRNGLEVW